MGESLGVPKLIPSEDRNHLLSDQKQRVASDRDEDRTPLDLVERVHLEKWGIYYT